MIAESENKTEIALLSEIFKKDQLTLTFGHLVMVSVATDPSDILPVHIEFMIKVDMVNFRTQIA